jgi:hypothetical protein
MRGLTFAILLLTASVANAGTVPIASQSTLFGVDDRDARDTEFDRSAATLPYRRPVGFDGLASRLGLSKGKLNLYEFTDQPGTDRETHVTLGVGGKGLLLRVTW